MINKELIEKLENAYGCLIGTHTDNKTPQQQFSDIINELKQNDLSVVVSGSLIDVEYWKQKCKLMEAIDEESPCDPDITEDQIKAWQNYHNFIKEHGNGNDR